MKNLLIIGVPRAGKSSLANMICDKFGCGLISIDVIVATFYKIFPELGMHEEPEKSEPILSKFLRESHAFPVCCKLIHIIFGLPPFGISEFKT